MEPLINKIISASIELFRQYGFKTITMDDIARHTALSKKTLYQHFANKHEVVNDSVIWYKEQMSDTIDTLIKDTENALDAMVRMLAFMDDMNRRINPMALYELKKYFPEAYNKFRELLVEKDVVMLRNNITQGMQEGLYRQKLNADLLARYRLETSLLILQPHLLLNEESYNGSILIEIGEHFLYGIMTQKGVELYHKYKVKYLNQATTI